ncbi:hypothetical protein L3Y34_007464 [Caenorhabditis briggsae]|uniref:Uncharacterized protein n=1 Tax=Caenorhabditis briggsae TaxID=6238 RepID=A0AAE8ZWX4_CAEBR|nr:hypothetical protein L3Y34_007464 [Caenorhabditis briggsae]
MRTTIFKCSVVLLNFFSVIYMIPFLIGEPEQTSAVERLKESIKNPPCDLWDPHVYVFFDGSNKCLIFCYGFLMMITGSLMFSLVFHSFKVIRNFGSTTSKSSQNRHLGFFYALILIALVPNVFLIFPITGMLIGAENSMSYNPALGEYMVSSLSIHGVLSTLTLILSHKPYRLEADRLRRKLFCSELRSQK